MNNKLSDLFATVTRKNNTLMELTQTQYDRIKDYSIHVSNPRLNDGDK